MKTKKKEKQPQYYVSLVNTPARNYYVYYLSLLEKIAYFLIAFVVGALIGYLFYGGLAIDQLGNATSLTHKLNAIVCIVTGTITGFIYIPFREKQLAEKKRLNLKLQFRELLDSLTTSLGSGKNVTDSFQNAYEDLKVLYDEEADILIELKIILHGLNNNVGIEAMLMDFGKRSGLHDVISFANVFQTCYRKGGNIRDVIKNTRQIISEKMEVEMEIQTIVASSEREQKIMSIMPVALIGAIKMMSPEFGKNYSTMAGIVATTIAIVIFVIAIFIGKKLLKIQV